MMMMMMMLMCVACYDNQFRCDNGQCISACKRCDEQSDCDDDSDEADCCKLLFTLLCAYILFYCDIFLLFIVFKEGILA